MLSEQVLLLMDLLFFEYEKTHYPYRSNNIIEMDVCYGMWQGSSHQLYSS